MAEEGAVDHAVAQQALHRLAERGRSLWADDQGHVLHLAQPGLEIDDVDAVAELVRCVRARTVVYPAEPHQRRAGRDVQADNLTGVWLAGFSPVMAARHQEGGAVLGAVVRQRPHHAHASRRTRPRNAGQVVVAVQILRGLPRVNAGGLARGQQPGRTEVIVEKRKHCLVLHQRGNHRALVQQRVDPLGSGPLEIVAPPALHTEVRLQRSTDRGSCFGSEDFG